MNNEILQPVSLHLLALAALIRKYDEALTRGNGEKFNLFEILHVGHYEVRTHSPLLAELLDPRGSHGQGTVFLKHFLDALALQEFDAESARVNCELSIGDLGRLDIEITNRDGQSIFIENKIYAGLQERQLERYHHHNKNAKLLFLTLDGENPPDWETNSTYKTEAFHRVFKPLSYKTEIVGWLKLCRKEATTAPGVREVISQYINLIQRLTRQNTSTYMNEEIIKTVITDKTGGTYLAYAALRNADGDIRNAIIQKVNAQWEALGRELGLETLELLSAKGVKEEQCYYTTPAMKAKNLKFGLRCSFAGYRDFVYGFAYMDSNLDRPSSSPLLARFADVFSIPPKSNGFWHAYEYWRPGDDWGDQTMAAIISGAFADDLDKLVRKLVQVANESAAATVPDNPFSTLKGA